MFSREEVRRLVERARSLSGAEHTDLTALAKGVGMLALELLLAREVGLSDSEWTRLLGQYGLMNFIVSHNRETSLREIRQIVLTLQARLASAAHGTRSDASSLRKERDEALAKVAVLELQLSAHRTVKHVALREQIKTAARRLDSLDEARAEIQRLKESEAQLRAALTACEAKHAQETKALTAKLERMRASASRWRTKVLGAAVELASMAGEEDGPLDLVNRIQKLKRAYMRVSAAGQILAEHLSREAEPSPSEDVGAAPVPWSP